MCRTSSVELKGQCRLRLYHCDHHCFGSISFICNSTSSLSPSGHEAGYAK